MNKKLSNSILGCLSLSSAFAFAGPVASAKDTILPEPAAKSDWFKFSLDARLRYEFREVSALDASHAGTLRVRPGIALMPVENLTLFAESEHTFAFIDDYQVGTPQSAILSPFVAGNTPIGDPENNELNQAYVKYKFSDVATVTAGRQRYILNNAAFVGNVGWRQNEQTLDAVSIKGSANGFSYSYAIGDRVNRIFGSDANGPVKALEGTFHLLNGSYKFNDSTTLGGYVFLMDFDTGGWASNNTYGVYSKMETGSGNYHVEFAYQTEAGDKADYDAFYSHVTWSKKFGSVGVNAGLEYLEEGFVTPLATVHAFNGFADQFIAQRLGLPGASWDGLTDIYVGANTKVSGVVLKGFIHAYFDDSMSEQYGWEIDAVAVKPINKNMKVLAKAAYFIADEDGPFANDIKQFSLQLDYKF